MKISAEKIQSVMLEVDDYLIKHYGFYRNNITSATDAWTIADRIGFSSWCYAQEGVHDAHIQTALEYIFHNAQFKDPKRY